jgi:hypothetical protein
MNTEQYNLELRENWRPQWLSSINELTNFELQKLSWLDSKVRNPHWSFVEFMCSYFDDLGLDNNYKDPLQRGLLTNQEFEIIKNWHEELYKYKSLGNNDYDDIAILNDPEWLKILQIGLVAKNKLAEILSDFEKQILTEEINYLKYL